jgi:hypothetical protein
MSQGINAGVVELQKLGLEAKRTARDVSTLKTLEISRAFISGVSAIANTFRSFTAGALNSIDATRQLSESLGVSFQELRTLQVAADLSGASAESLAQAFTRAQLTISRAAGGSKEARAALAALGLSVDDLAKQTTTQQFASIAQAITQIENPAQRAAAAVAIFGRNGAALLPTFRELPENLRTAQQFLGRFNGGQPRQELLTVQKAAEIAGVSSKSLANAFSESQRTIAAATNGSGRARAALQALGLSVDDLAKQTTVQSFSAIAASISEIQNPAQRAAAAVSVLGSTGKELIPTFRELPKNLLSAQEQVVAVSGALGSVDATRIDAIGDSFTLASQAIQELAGRVLSELQPALTQGAQQFVAFIQSIDVPAAARSVQAFLQDLADLFGLAARAAVPLASNLLPAIGGYLAFINRQIIGAGIANLARDFAAATAAALGYSAASGTAAAATAVLAASIRSLLASTGIGLLVVALGVAGGALVDWAVSAQTSSADAGSAIAGATSEVQRFTNQAQQANLAAVGLGEEIKNSLKVPELSVQDFAQDSLSEARSAIVSLAKELGGLEKIPAEVRTRFEEIAKFAGTITEETLNETQALRLVEQDSRALIGTVQQLADANKRQADAAREAADAARKGAEEARQRTATLATEGLPKAEAARLQLNKDLLAIQQEQRAAEQALADARAARDSKAVADAKARLGLIQQARDAAFKQNRERQRQALGVDENIIKPAQSIADQFKNLRNQFTQQAIDPQEFQIGLRNLAEEGIRIRREIAADLSRPANRALQAADVRTQEGAAQFAALASGREDPAIAQRREQLAKLDEIRRALISINIRPVEILGG